MMFLKLEKYKDYTIYEGETYDDGTGHYRVYDPSGDCINFDGFFSSLKEAYAAIDARLTGHSVDDLMDVLSGKAWCPGCGSFQFLELVTEGATCTTVVRVVGDEDECLVFGKPKVEGGFSSRFQCSNCGAVAKNESGYPITEDDEAVEYVLNHRERL